MGGQPGCSVALVASAAQVTAEAAMQNAEYAARVDAAKQRAHGRWTEIPRSHGAGGTAAAAQADALPCSAKTAWTASSTPTSSAKATTTAASAVQAAASSCCRPGRAWTPRRPLCRGEGVGHVATGPAVRRCRARAHEEAGATHLERGASRQPLGTRWIATCGAVGLPGQLSPSLRFHPALGYYQKEERQKGTQGGRVPAMLASVEDAQGAVTLHRTYLKAGRKLDATDAKKVLSSGFTGAAVRLAEATEELAVCEGIETGVAVFLATGKPVWCALSAGNPEKLWVPDTVRSVCVYGDNDADGDFTGQASAYAVARRLQARRGPGWPSRDPGLPAAAGRLGLG